VCCMSWWAFMARLPPNEWLLRTGVDLLLNVTCSNWTWLSNWKGSFLVIGTVKQIGKTYSSTDLVTSSNENHDSCLSKQTKFNETLPDKNSQWCQSSKCHKFSILGIVPKFR
jgi:hypothetical protein